MPEQRPVPMNPNATFRKMDDSKPLSTGGGPAIEVYVSDDLSLPGEQEPAGE